MLSSNAASIEIKNNNDQRTICFKEWGRECAMHFRPRCVCMGVRSFIGGMVGGLVGGFSGVPIHLLGCLATPARHLHHNGHTGNFFQQIVFFVRAHQTAG